MTWPDDAILWPENKSANPPVDDGESPALRDADPPMPVADAPTASVMSPLPFDPLVTPVAISIEPPIPAADLPEPTEIEPLDTAFALTISTLPLALCEL